jgi:hypothetical protein
VNDEELVQSVRDAIKANEQWVIFHAAPKLLDLIDRLYYDIDIFEQHLLDEDY